MRCTIHKSLALGLVCVAATASAAEYPPTVTLEDARALVERAPREHPRLLAGPGGLQALAGSIEPGSVRALVAGAVVRDAEELLDASPVTRTLQGRRLLGRSRECLERVLALSTAFHLTGDERFVRRCEKEMLAAAAFSDWNPSHFLDVGEMCLALAIGYDWLFEQLSPDSRATIRTAIVEKALKLPFETRHRGWVRATNNWGQVCHAGLTAGALAVLEDEPELAARTVHQAATNVTRSMAAFAPDGSYPEGPSYWSYGTSFNVILIAALESVLGTDLDLSAAPGFAETGQYLAMVTGPSGRTFNYADGSSGRRAEPALHWLARRFERPDWLRGELDRLRDDATRGGRLLPLSLLWLDESAAPLADRMPLHWSAGGEVPITIHRSSWRDEDAVFVGFKGGSPSANHGNMDVGSFVLDADGVRWALDLGAEGYHGIESRGMNLWDRSQGSDRWRIFRQMNHGHNTLVIDDQLQRARGFGQVVAFSDSPTLPHSVIDMSTAYEGQVSSARRGIALLPSREVVIQDELSGLRPGATVRWGMITPATPSEASSDTIELRQGDATLLLRVESPTGSVWKTIDTARPREEWDSPNPGTVMVALEATAPESGTLILRVVARPGSAPAPKTPSGAPSTLAEWR